MHAMAPAAPIRRPYMERIKPPRQHQQRDYREHDQGCGPTDRRQDGEEEGERVEIKDHDVDKANCHPDDFVLEPRKQDEEDDHHK